jgi:hypothetical protein
VDSDEDPGGGDHAAEPYDQAMFDQINPRFEALDLGLGRGFETLDLGFEALNVGPRRDIVMNHIEPLAYESRVARQCRA